MKKRKEKKGRDFVGNYPTSPSPHRELRASEPTLAHVKIWAQGPLDVDPQE
jgi:hypothetical protein